MGCLEYKLLRLQVTAIEGPAMTWSMFLIGWLELHEENKAAEMLRRNYRYIAKEFQVKMSTSSYHIESALQFLILLIHL